MSATNPLGDFLRARRDLITPQEVGLRSSKTRRVPGLRREELALLADISVDYYLRLEQGKDHNPSPEVLDSLARALRLDAAGTTYLHQLAYRHMRPRQISGRERDVAPGVLALINSWPMNPAHVQAPDTTVLASNQLARAISPTYEPGTNALRAAFLDPALRRLYRDWPAMTERIVSGVRAAAGPQPQDSPLSTVIAELTEKSPEFLSLWNQHGVHPSAHDVALLDHPLVGEMDLTFEKFIVEESNGQRLLVFHAEPGSTSEVALRRLAESAGLSPT